MPPDDWPVDEGTVVSVVPAAPAVSPVLVWLLAVPEHALKTNRDAIVIAKTFAVLFFIVIHPVYFISEPVRAFLGYLYN